MTNVASFRETSLGFEMETTKAFFFFGKKDASFDHLKAFYHDYRWARIRQTHSDIVKQSITDSHVATVEADAHWTRQKKLALLISTADCTPVLLVSSDGKAVAAIHAGWRGVASRIVPKTLTTLFKNSVPADDAWIGPHIKQSSFEVDADVRDQLVASSALKANEVVRDRADGKFAIDLEKIVRAQLSEFDLIQPVVLDLDTKTDLSFQSHRRDRELSGRQLSFVVLK